jgi:methylaspartate ammonia-lyase
MSPADLRIEELLFAPGLGAFYYDDQAAIAAGATLDGFVYRGQPVTPGFKQIRMPAESLSIGLRLCDGFIAWGDMMSVQYSGAGGREAGFSADRARQIVERHLRSRMIGSSVASFVPMCDALFEGARECGPAIEYGLSQALLRAVAHARRKTMAEVLCEEFERPVVAKAVPIYAQSGDERVPNTDKMILKRVDVLPHGLINSAAKFGPSGATFLQFLDYVSSRVRSLGGPHYRPTLHFDLYGWVGRELGLNIGAITDFVVKAAAAAAPFTLHLESPADFGEREAHLRGYSDLIAAVTDSGCGARIVVDEWCNTLDDVQAFVAARAAHIVQIKSPDVGSLADIARAVNVCKVNGVGAYVGGSCTETDLSCRATVHVAVAMQADMMLAKPGMGVDEALSITGNEQRRLLAVLASRERG